MAGTGAPRGPRAGERAARGRPRSARAEAAILDATVELLAEVGLDGTTIQAIAERAEVARATIYLRWSTREALITAALRHAIGRPPFPLTGDIEADLRLGSEQAQGILSQPLFASVLPALVREFIQLDRAGVTFDRLFPNRKRVAEEYDRLASSQGFSEEIDGFVVVDLVVGALFLHLLATGTPPTDAYREQMVDVVLAGVRRRLG
jgi:AcrR family transcriptional regulator